MLLALSHNYQALPLLALQVATSRPFRLSNIGRIANIANARYRRRCPPRQREHLKGTHTSALFVLSFFENTQWEPPAPRFRCPTIVANVRNGS